MSVGVVLLVLNDAAAKWLVARYGPLQILFVRSALALPMAAGLVVWLDGPQALRSHRVGVHAARAALAVAATLAFIGSLRTLGLAEATALIFTAPIIVAALSAAALGERVGARRWGAVLLGFAGALVVVRPGADAFQPASLLALAAAALNALVMVSARWVDARDGIGTMAFHMTLFSGLFGTVALFGAWPAFERGDAAMFGLMALFGTGGVALISQAFRMAPASLVAPIDYTALLWASLVGWAVWGTVPDLWVYVGAGIIIAGAAMVLTAGE